MQLSPNTYLQNGKYRILRVLGQGGFGITYLAENVNLGTTITIKEFYPKDYCNRLSSGKLVFKSDLSRHKSKFISEAKKIAQLNHPNIVKVLDVFEENGTAYYIMDYIQGQPLNEVLKTKSFTINEAIRIFEKIAAAVEHIHSKRMLHLDIKPANIMMHGNTPILIDFGISKTYDSQGEQNTSITVGYTGGYAPVEQMAGNVSSFAPQVDIYSLGATFYNFLTRNQPPYPTPRSVTNLVFPSDVPQNIVEAIRKAMAYEQGERFKSISELINTIFKKNESPSAFNDKDKNIRDSAKQLRDSLESDPAPWSWGSYIISTLLSLALIWFPTTDEFKLSIAFLGPLVIGPLIATVSYFIVSGYNSSVLSKWKREHPNDPRSKFL